MPQWKWTIYESNELDKLLYEYLKSCKRIKESIVQAIEAFYLPYALKHTGASPLEIQKAYQRSIDTLQSRARIMALDAGMVVEINVEPANVSANVSPIFDSVNAALAGRQNGADDIDRQLPIKPPKRIMELED
jgi:hypothetical protein